MVRIYLYNDIRGFDQSRRRQRQVTSNLCTYYYKDKNKFCGNYCSRKPPHGHKFNRRCWRHKKLGTYSRSIPPVVLVMISASERFYNREMWIPFLSKCDESGIPIELVVYHEDMLNSTVRNAQNLLSRYRPFPDVYGSPIVSLRGAHGGINYAQTYIRMLEYACKIPHAARCIVLTERTIPIRSPAAVYRTAVNSNCHIDPSYQVKYGPLPAGLPEGPRGKPFQAVNNLAQGLFTVEFLRVALPTVPRHCAKFGIALQENGVYRVVDEELYNAWRAFTGANPSEFWLLNSWLLDGNTIRTLKSVYMEPGGGTDDKYTVAEFPQWRDNLRRSFVFKSFKAKYQIPHFDRWMASYYRGLRINRPLSLFEVIRFVRRHKKRALFFRQVELA